MLAFYLLMKTAKILRAKIDSESEITTGVICTNHFWPGMVELSMKAELDYLIIDLEHISYDAQMVGEACAIGRREGFPILIRPPAAEYTPLRMAMDLGPCGLLVPYVETAETMQEIQDAVYMKPRGRRRPGGFGNHWVEDFNYETWKAEVEDHFIIMPQIESRRGLENVDAIARHPLTSALAIGPYDLSADLGVCWDPEAEVLKQALQTVRDAGQRAGKNTWMIGDAPTLIKRGFTFLCLAEPTMFLQGQLTNFNRAVKNRQEPPDRSVQDLAGA